MKKDSRERFYCDSSTVGVEIPPRDALLVTGCLDHADRECRVGVSSANGAAMTKAEIALRKKRASDLRWYHRNKAIIAEKRRGYFRRYRVINAARIKRQQRWKRNPKSNRECSLRWARAHREKVAAACKRYGTMARKTLRDSYIKQLLFHNCRIPLKNFPRELVELKRAQLKLHRDLRKQKVR
jgi:hypothetical protein